MNQTEEIARLREAAEQKAGKIMRTPKDFDYLHDSIYEQCHELVSVSTLKRIWGYNKYDNTPRTSSLDPIARYIGFHDWEDFEQSLSNEISENSNLTESHEPNKKKSYRWIYTGLCILILIIGYSIWLWISQTKAKQNTETSPETILAPSGKRVLRKGQDCFHAIDEYLSLFGIESSDTAYFRPISNLQEVYVWGPEYHHPVWHNDGDTTLLMPTITEYWTPLPGEKDFQSHEYIKLANEKLYYERLDKDELRITFMKNIVDNYYVFLGIYRMDREQSTTAKTVWKRIADQCDLGNLTLLEQLRDENQKK